MKKLIPFILAGILISTLVLAGGDRERTPKVAYIGPGNDAVVNLKGEKSLTFMWKSGPVPGGGRVAYKFEIYKGFGYERVASETLDHDVFSKEVPAELFKSGELYSWQVKQRDRRTRLWSMDHRWSFKVVK